MVPCVPAVKQQDPFPSAQKRQENGRERPFLATFFSRREKTGQVLERAQNRQDRRHRTRILLPLLFPEPHSCPAPTLLTARQVNKVRRQPERLSFFMSSRPLYIGETRSSGIERLQSLCVSHSGHMGILTSCLACPPAQGLCVNRHSGLFL